MEQDFLASELRYEDSALIQRDQRIHQDEVREIDWSLGGGDCKIIGEANTIRLSFKYCSNLDSLKTICFLRQNFAEYETGWPRYCQIFGMELLFNLRPDREFNAPSSHTAEELERENEWLKASRQAANPLLWRMIAKCVLVYATFFFINKTLAALLLIAVFLYERVQLSLEVRKAHPKPKISYSEAQKIWEDEVVPLNQY